ncbi:MAG: hypothetical protein P8N76_27370 [Pirellulaceae bacterium]|nr:hypothetical protein [Pirellulaceae bacterium]
MITSDSAQFDSDTKLALWRNEVRQFCEETILELQKVTATLQSDLASTPDWTPAKKQPTAKNQPGQSTALTASPPTSQEPKAVACGDDDVGSSESRLENLKRQLSEKLSKSDSNPQILP